MTPIRLTVSDPSPWLTSATQNLADSPGSADTYSGSRREGERPRPGGDHEP